VYITNTLQLRLLDRTLFIISVSADETMKQLPC